MRLYPPAWSLARTVTKEVELGGYRLPVGANVVMSQWILHRDPRFFEQPEQSIPTAGPLRPPNVSRASPTSLLEAARVCASGPLSP